MQVNFLQNVNNKLSVDLSKVICIFVKTHMQTFMQKILSFRIQLLSSYLKEASKISLEVLQI